MLKRLLPVLMLLVLGIGTTYAQERCELCTGTPWITITKTIYLPGYPTCPVTYLYQTRICQPGNIVEMQGSGFYFDVADPNCSLLEGLMYPSGTSGTPDWTQIMWGYYAGLDEVIKADFMAWHLLNPTVNCPNGLRKYHVSTATCHAFYTVTVPANPTTGAGGYEQIFNTICSDEQCCIKEVNICWDPVTNSMQRTTNVITNGTLSIPCPRDGAQIPSGVYPHFVSDCTIDCFGE